MKIRTLICSTLLAGTMGLGMAGTAQADSSYSIRLYDREHYCPLQPGYRHHRRHDRGHHHRLHWKAPRRHHHEHDAYQQHRRGYQDRHHKRHDDRDGDSRHRSSYGTGIGYTGRH